MDEILSTFSQAELTQMLRYRLDKKLENIAPAAANLETIAFELVEAANRQGWIGDLSSALRDSRPSSQSFFEIVSELGIVNTASLFRSNGLERLINQKQVLLSLPEFWSRLANIERWVCHIVIKNKISQLNGTGILVKDNVVLTNYHVLKPVIAGHCRQTDVTLTFDYRKLNDGIKSGPSYSLSDSADWLLDYSEYSAEEDMPTYNEHSHIEPDKLDYALVRLNAHAGRAPVGIKSEPGSAVREWLALEQDPPEPQIGTIMFIVQHAQGSPVTIGFDTISGLNDSRTRMRYRVNTEPGSSGAPCFDSRLQFIGIHNFGSPDLNTAAPFNQGVPLRAIVNQLRKRQKLNQLLS